jgi:LysM repeat protein
MTPSVGKKHRLSNMEYDEVSFVDVGANQDAHIVLCKRVDEKGTSSPKPAGGGGEAPRKADWYAADREPGNADGSKRKKGDTQRAQNWRENKHPRNAKGSGGGGQFAHTSNASKEKYGRGGTTAANSGKTAGGGTYTVQKGDTLKDIAESIYGDPEKWKLIADANGIKDPNNIPPGTKLKIPVVNPPEAAPKRPVKRKVNPPTSAGSSGSSTSDRSVMSPGGNISQQAGKTTGGSSSKNSPEYQKYLEEKQAAQDEYDKAMADYTKAMAEYKQRKQDQSATNSNTSAVNRNYTAKQKAAAASTKKKTVKKSETRSLVLAYLMK